MKGNEQLHRRYMIAKTIRRSYLDLDSLYVAQLIQKFLFRLIHERNPPNSHWTLLLLLLFCCDTNDNRVA